jgi:hypothetical protein
MCRFLIERIQNKVLGFEDETKRGAPATRYVRKRPEVRRKSSRSRLGRVFKSEKKKNNLELTWLIRATIFLIVVLSFPLKRIVHQDVGVNRKGDANPAHLPL